MTDSSGAPTIMFGRKASEVILEDVRTA